MKKVTFDNSPELVVNEGKVVRINFDVESAEQTFPAMDGGEDIVRTVYMAYVVRVSQPVTRDKIINAIVTANFPNDKMQAVVNNYLATPEDAERKQEFGDMQAWRIHAKEIADQVMSQMTVES